MPAVKANYFDYYEHRCGRSARPDPIPRRDNACYGFQVAEYAKHSPAYAGSAPHTTVRKRTSLTPPDTRRRRRRPRWPHSGSRRRTSRGSLRRRRDSAVDGGEVLINGEVGSEPRRVGQVGCVLKSENRRAPAGDCEGDGSVPEMVINALLPWCLTLDLYVTDSSTLQGLKDAKPPPHSLCSRNRQPSSWFMIFHADGCRLQHELRESLRGAASHKVFQPEGTRAS